MFIVMTSAASVQRRAWRPESKYKNIAVVELENGFKGKPRMISERAKGVKRIVDKWGPLHVGKTKKCAYQKQLQSAMELAARLNIEKYGKPMPE